MSELLPLWVVRLIEIGRNLDWELHRAPSLVAERMRRLLAAIADGTGPIADFSYSPAFAARADTAREQVAAGQFDAGWDTVHSALPLWTPMSRNHLAPVGLYYDKDLRQLLTPPRWPRAARPIDPEAAAGRAYVVMTTVSQRSPAQPTSTASITRLAQRKLHSQRTLAILTAPCPVRPTDPPS